MCSSIPCIRVRPIQWLHLSREVSNIEATVRGRKAPAKPALSIVRISTSYCGSYFLGLRARALSRACVPQRTDTHRPLPPNGRSNVTGYSSGYPKTGNHTSGPRETPAPPRRRERHEFSLSPAIAGRYPCHGTEHSRRGEFRHIVFARRFMSSTTNVPGGTRPKAPPAATRPTTSTDTGGVKTGSSALAPRRSEKGGKLKTCRASEEEKHGFRERESRGTKARARPVVLKEAQRTLSQALFQRDKSSSRQYLGSLMCGRPRNLEFFQSARLLWLW